MFESISRGWSLTKSSFRVLKLDKEILALPILSGVILLAVWLTLGIPLALMYGLFGDLALVGLFGMYVVSYFVVIFFNTAIVEMASIRFAGGDPVLKDGLRASWNRKFRILQWAIVAATVGLILKVLENAARSSQNQMMRLVGSIGVWIAGAAWNIATFFVVPVIVHKDIGPFDAIKASLQTFRRAWGESATGVITTGIIFFLLALVAIVPVGLGIMIGGAFGLVFFALAGLWLVGVWAMSGAIDAILVAALYQYATTGQLPQVMEQNLNQPLVAA